MSFAGVLFDKDGTLVDFQRTWGPATFRAMEILAAGDPLAVERQARALHYSMAKQAFLKTSPLIAGSSATYAEIWAEALGRTDVAALRREIDALTAIEALKFLTPIGDPRAVLSSLKALGLRLGVATNDSEASARRQLAALGIDDLVEFVAGYDSGHGGKPDPGMVEAFARALNAEPNEVALVGDATHDLDAAKAAGATAIAVLSGPADRATLEPHADHVVDDISRLPDLLQSLSRRSQTSAYSAAKGR